MKKVSIIVPVYNVEKYLKKCLDSLVNQTFKDIEIIIVNDGSPDDSQKIIDEYQKKYPKLIKSYIKENGGLGSARNYGISKSNGEYICFVDSDDYVEINMFEKIFENNLNKDIDIILFGNNVVDDSYNLIEKNTVVNCNNCKNIFKYLLNSNICVWNKIYKKKLIVNNNIEFRSKVWYEDVDFVLKAISRTKKIAVVNEYLYNYLIRNGSIMNNSNVKRNLELIESFQETIKYYKKNKIFKKYHSEIEFLCIYHIYICGISRLINITSNKKEKNIAIKKYIKYMKENFSNFKKNKYLKELSKSKQIIYFLINTKNYYIIRLIFKIKMIFTKLKNQV